MGLGSLERFNEMLSELIVRAIDLNKIVRYIYIMNVYDNHLNIIKILQTY